MNCLGMQVDAGASDRTCCDPKRQRRLQSSRADPWPHSSVSVGGRCLDRIGHLCIGKTGAPELQVQVERVDLNDAPGPGAGRSIDCGSEARE